MLTESRARVYVLVCVKAAETVWEAWVCVGAAEAAGV
jgi:hypothetical protein